MYSEDPCQGVAEADEPLVLGGGGAEWGDDASTLGRTVWPRLAAIAERLWSPRSVNDTALAEPRYDAFRCLLNCRGVQAAPARNADARAAPPGPGGCYGQ